MLLTDLEAKKIAKIMCQSTLHVFNELIPSGFNFETRVGHGKKTYHRKIGLNQSIITYGFKAILSKQSSFSKAAGWLSTKEIIKYKFFNGNVTFKNLIIHTVIHEFSHFIQCLRGHRLLNSVHNDQFYSILKEMYDKNYHIKISDYFDNHYPEINNIHFNKDSSSLENSKNQMLFNSENLNHSDIIKVVSNEKILKMKIIKLNPKNAKAICLESNITYNVPYSLIKEKLNNEDFNENHIKDLGNLEKPTQFKKIKVIINGKENILDVEKINKKTITAKIDKGIKTLVYRVPYHLVLEYI